MSGEAVLVMSAIVGAWGIGVYSWLRWARSTRPRGIQFPRDVPDGSQACSVCGFQTSELVAGKCPDHGTALDPYEFVGRPCRWTPPEFHLDGPATSHTIADCAARFAAPPPR